MEEAVRAKERYRVENSSLLKLQKGKMHIPLNFPFYKRYAFSNYDIYSNRNFDTIFLRNSGIGTASTIDVEVKFINDHEFNEFKFDTHVDKDGNDRVEPARVKRSTLEYPKYRLEPQYIVTNNARGKIRVNFAYFSTKHNKMVDGTLTFLTNGLKPKRIGTQEKGDEFHILLPRIYRQLAHHFFLERNMIDEEEWVTPNPRLRVRVTYTEDVLEHMNDLAEARRVKEFEISCNEDVRIISLKEDTEFGRHYLLCDFNIQTMFDRPLSALSIEESPEEETIDGSTGATEG